MKTSEDSPDPREEKLPRWAQTTLRRLRQQLQGAEEKLEARNAEFSDTIADIYSDHPLLLSRGEHLRFVLDPENHINVHIETLASGQRMLNVQSSGAAGAYLAIHPSAANVVRIGVTE